MIGRVCHATGMGLPGLGYALDAPTLEEATPTRTLDQPGIGARTKPTIEVDGLVFRDLDADGRLTPYEDWRLPAA